MKLSALFAKYLYQHRQLSLPGIGVFSIDPSIVIPDPADKNAPEFTQEIKFSQQQVAAADEGFINFIRTETGKIRPLAESDLESFLADGKILLNIGKPFYFEGIGALQKNRSGEYEFTPGTHIVPARTEPQIHDASPETAKRSLYTEQEQTSTTSRKIIIALSIIVGIALVIWLGYGLYNRNAQPQIVSDDNPVQTIDTPKANIILDSVKSIINSEIQNESGNYKFVIERTASKARAIKRFNQIKENLTDIKLESSSDSSSFSLYFILPATPADTTRIKDSLKVWYGRKEVFIEH